jgi:glycolate oxidase iron-sulfur subunit
MQTRFSESQMQDPGIAEANDILRKCVHCGFCTATCPTYVTLGDELDSPRGRIYLIKEMLEGGKPATAATVRHLDRCLTCLSCTTTCPSGVDYMHLLDHGRRRVEETYQRPLTDRWLRGLLKWLLPKPALFRLALVGAKFARPFAPLFPGRLSAMLKMSGAPVSSPSPVDRPQVHSALGKRKMRVAMLSGCAQQVVGGDINEATVRLLRRHGVEVVIASGMGCCGALTQHMGDEAAAQTSARANIAAWLGVRDDGGLDAIVINASGCGTTVKDYGHLLQHDPQWADKAAEVSALTLDVSELMVKVGLLGVDLPPEAKGLDVAYHAACSLQHGQKVTSPPKDLLRQAGYTIRDVGEAHLCCGSAGTYNLLQPEIADQLGQRKAANLHKTGADIVAAGNIGCMVQISAHSGLPVVHTVELLDWATGGPKPSGLSR